MQLHIKKTKMHIRMIALIVANILIIGGTILFCYAAPEEEFWMAMGMGALMFLIALMMHCAILTDWRARNIKGPIITINEEGVYDRRYLKRPLAWGKLEWRRRYSKGYPYIIYNFRTSKEEYLLHRGFFSRFMMGGSKLFGFGDLYIEAHFFDCDAEELYQEFLKYKRENTRKTR